MQPRETTHTLLEAQDLLAKLDYRGGPLLRRDVPAPRRGHHPPPMLHDFLVLSPRPDLTPDLLTPAAAGGQSWERNRPQK